MSTVHVRDPVIVEISSPAAVSIENASLVAQPCRRR
jgi:hypothetical protein